MFSAWGLTIKKAPNLVGMGLLTCFVTPEVEKSNVYGDLERIMEWEDSDIKNEKQKENEVKQKRDCEAATKLMTLSLSFSFCFVTSEVEKSNFYKDLEGVRELEYSREFESYQFGPIPF